MSMTLEQALELGFRAGFIRGCNWPAPISQDVDSPAFAEETAQFIETHAPVVQPAQGEAVAWMCETINGYKAFSVEGPNFPCNAGKVTPLYTAQPAQSVDVEKVREVIASHRHEIALCNKHDQESIDYLTEMTDKLTAALQEKGNG